MWARSPPAACRRCPSPSIPYAENGSISSRARAVGPKTSGIGPTGAWTPTPSASSATRWGTRGATSGTPRRTGVAGWRWAPGARRATDRAAFMCGHLAAGDPYARRNPPVLLGACESCHSRRVEHAPYVPGGEFLDSFEPELLDTDLYYADGQVKAELYEVVSFQMSRMYAQGVRCWNCHDVHGGGTKGTGNALCLGCHAPS